MVTTENGIRYNAYQPLVDLMISNGHLAVARLDG